MSFTPAHSRAGRALLNWSQDKLAEISGVSTKTIADFERGSRTPYARTLAELEQALSGAGVEFTNGGQPGVRLSRRKAMLAAAADYVVEHSDKIAHSQKKALNPSELRDTETWLRDEARTLRSVGSAKELEGSLYALSRRGMFLPNEMVGQLAELFDERVVNSSDSIMKLDQLNVGDFVRYRDDRPGPSVGNLGKLGKIIDPGHKAPFPTYVCVEFDADGGKWVDRGMLLLAGKKGD